MLQIGLDFNFPENMLFQLELLDSFFRQRFQHAEEFGFTLTNQENLAIGATA